MDSNPYVLNPDSDHVWLTIVFIWVQTSKQCELLHSLACHILLLLSVISVQLEQYTQRSLIRHVYLLHKHVCPNADRPAL